MLSFAVGVLTCLIVMVSPIATHASAVGIQYWGTFTVNVDGQSINIPSGQLTHEINGKGYHITWDGANFISAANLCDPSIHFTYGNGAYELRGNVHL